jgi:predicted DNA-binding transcriptional regulator AlpA
MALFPFWRIVTVTDAPEMALEFGDLLTIPELALLTKIPCSWLYERTRHNSLPGMVRIGKYIRVVREPFFEALRRGEVR